MADDSDDRNYIEQVQSRAKAYGGKEISSDEMARNFVKCGIDARVDILERLKADDRPLTLNEAAKRHSFESALKRTHENLRKIGE